MAGSAICDWRPWYSWCLWSILRAITWYPGTASAAVAAATFGMVAGTILGAPVGERIIKMHKVKTPYENPELMEDEGIDMIEDHVESGGKQFNSQDLLTICMWIGLALGIGTIVSAGLSVLTHYLHILAP